MDLQDTVKVVTSLQTSAPKDVNIDELAAALVFLARHYYDSAKRPSMKGVRGAPDWMGYETLLWDLDEQTVRPFLKKRRDLRRRANVLLDSVATLASDSRHGKGRQSLVMILGEFGDASYVDTLKSLLNDREVVGHAIKALTKVGAPGLASAIEEIEHSSKDAWIRNAAKAYLRKFGR